MPAAKRWRGFPGAYPPFEPDRARFGEQFAAKAEVRNKPQPDVNHRTRRPQRNNQRLPIERRCSGSDHGRGTIDRHSDKHRCLCRRCRHVTRWSQPCGKHERRQNQAHQWQQPQRVSGLRTEVARDRPACDQNGRDQRTGPYEGVKQPVHRRSSLSRASISVRSCSVSASLSARCANSGAARPPNSLSTSRFDSLPT